MNAAFRLENYESALTLTLSPVERGNRIPLAVIRSSCDHASGWGFHKRRQRQSPLPGEIAALGIAERRVSVEFELKAGRRKHDKPLITNIKTFGDWIRASRVWKNLTPGHLATKMGIAAALIRSWEKNTSEPSQEQMEDLTKVFRESSAWEIVN